MPCSDCQKEPFGSLYYDGEKELCLDCYREKFKPVPVEKEKLDTKIQLFGDFIDGKVTQLPKNLHKEFLAYCEEHEPLLKIDIQSRDIQKKYVRAYQKIKMSA